MTLPRIHSDRKFGVEIECFGLSIDHAVAVIRSVGIDCVSEGYNHATRNHWKIVTDSSVADGFEVVSPILSGTEGLEAVQKVARVLVNNGARVDRRCGFHVHVDARDLNGASILNCIRRYAFHETAIDAMMPVSRRATNNSFCRAMEDVVFSVRNISESATCSQVAQRIYERYYKLNVQSFLRHGTVEFRQHSGTVDYRKMANWIIFCVAFVEDSRVISVPLPVEVSAPPVPGSVLRRNAIELKFAKLAEILDAHNRRYEPVSAAYIASMLNVEESSVPSYISQFRSRYPLAQIQARRGWGYYREGSASLVAMVRGAENAPVALMRLETPPDLGIFASVSPEVENYFRERSIDFAIGN